MQCLILTFLVEVGLLQIFIMDIDKTLQTISFFPCLKFSEVNALTIFTFSFRTTLLSHSN